MAKSNKKQEAEMMRKEAPQFLSDHPFYGFKMDPDQVAFTDSIWDPESKIIFCNSKAGTGKTQMAYAVANLLYEYGFYDGIIYVVSPYGEAKQGFLPGDITEKSEVYFEPLYQAIIKCNQIPSRVIYNEAMTAACDKQEQMGFVKCLTHTYLRGTNFENKVVILDESQNFGFMDLKKTLTRISDDCKVIVIGHDEQKDTEDKSNAFMTYLNYYSRLKESSDEEVSKRIRICKLTKNYRGWLSQTADDCKP